MPQDFKGGYHEYNLRRLPNCQTFTSSKVMTPSLSRSQCSKRPPSSFSLILPVTMNAYRKNILTRYVVCWGISVSVSQFVSHLPTFLSVCPSVFLSPCLQPACLSVSISVCCCLSVYDCPVTYVCVSGSVCISFLACVFCLSTI